MCQYGRYLPTAGTVQPFKVLVIFVLCIVSCLWLQLATVSKLVCTTVTPKLSLSIQLQQLVPLRYDVLHVVDTEYDHHAPHDSDSYMLGIYH